MKTKKRFESSNNCVERGLRDAVDVPLRIAAGLLMTITLVAAGRVQAAGDDSGLRPSDSPVRFAVISDPHLYSARLGVSGVAFEAYLNQDPKLLRDSEAILEAAIEGIIQEGVRFVIIPGDLTKDGELVNHALMARHLARLERQGVQAFVVPGNHDINNPDAVAFRGDTTRRVASVSPRMFARIYNRFGYGEAIERDQNSLSYVAEPLRGLWLIGIDSTDTAANRELGYPKVGGKLSPATLAWVMAKVEQAHTRGKQVIAFMHHGANPDFVAQPLLFPDFLVDDWPMVNTALVSAGLRVIFTGHYHAQDGSYLCDATLTPVSPLCDVETGSLVLFPCAYRLVTVQPEGQLHVESRRVTEVEADTGGMPFQEYAEAFLRPRVQALAAYQLEFIFGLPHDLAMALAPFFTDAVIAGYVGDESPDAEAQAIIAYLMGNPQTEQLGMLLWGLWTDPPEADNQLVVSLTN